MTSFRRDLQITVRYLCFDDFSGKQETVVWLVPKKFLKMNTIIREILQKKGGMYNLMQNTVSFV